MTAASHPSQSEPQPPLRVLHLEDNPRDFQVAKCILQQGGLRCECHRLEDREAFIAALVAERWDFILADYTVPGFLGDEALALARHHAPDIPFIFLAGTLELGQAVETLKLGATDFVLKSEMERLVPVIRRALRQAQADRAHRQDQELLRERESRFRDVFLNSSDGIFFVRVEADGTIRFTEINPAAEEDLGLRGREVRDRTPHELLPAPVADLLVKDFRTCLEAGESTLHETSVPLEGARKWLQTVLVPLRNPQGQIHGIAGFARDITDRIHAEETKVRLEAQLRQAQKMEAIGTLAGGIAHDFNNILGAIAAFAELARIDTADRPEAQENLGHVIRAAGRARELIAQILTFSRHQRQERKPVELQPVLREALRLLRSILPATIEIATNIREDAPRVLAEPTQVHQILMNLCANAAHAMRGRPGKLEVDLEPWQADEHFAERYAAAPRQLYARLTVSDTGHGMDEGTVKRIFDPFFTTKAAEEGTGLGLAVVYGIVREHEGVIEVASTPGRGSVFRIYFPALSTEVTESQTVTAQTHRGHGERILYVDDEDSLCRAVPKMLTRLGYRPEASNSPEKALELFRAQPEAFDLLITDLTMPKMNGVDLATEIMALRPGLPVLLATGYSGAFTPEMVRSLGIYDVVMKPITMAVLAEAVYGALHQNT